MSNITKQEILDAIGRTAKENGGVPLGIGRFEKETGIKLYDINRYWSTISDAQREAGFTPNTLQTAHSKDFLIESIIALIREIGRLPTRGDLLVKRNKDFDFPSHGSFDRLGNKNERVEKISEYAKQKGYDDIVKICKKVIESPSGSKGSDTSDISQEIGEVYLFKSGRYYKIGKTNDTVRRGSEIRIQLPEKMTLIHSIKTDDPSGIEAYWHRRFNDKRMQGEWFDLSASDVKAFKRWRRIS